MNKESLKIALVGPVYPYRGGIAHYTTALSIAISNSGHKIIVFSFSRQYPRWLYPGKIDKDPSKLIQPIQAVFSIDTLNPISWHKTANLMAQFRPDLVILQWWTTFMAPAFWTVAKKIKNLNIPNIFIIHNVYPHEPRPFDSYMIKSTLDISDALIVHSIREKEKLTLLFPWKKIYHHEMPLFGSYGNVNKIDKNVAKDHLKLEQTVPIILFFGIVRPYKGLNDLLHSLAILKKENYKFLLLIAGEFWEDIKKYKKLIYELQLENNVRIENRYICNEEIGYYFSAADLFIAPYREGTQSASVRLALSYGIPIIISDAIEDDLIVNSGRVEIFERGNIPSLVMTIKKIIGNILSERNQRIKPLNINDTWSSFIDLIQQISFDLRYSIKSDTNLLQ